MVPFLQSRAMLSARVGRGHACSEAEERRAAEPHCSACCPVSLRRCMTLRVPSLGCVCPARPWPRWKRSYCGAGPLGLCLHKGPSLFLPAGCLLPTMLGACFSLSTVGSWVCPGRVAGAPCPPEATPSCRLPGPFPLLFPPPAFSPPAAILCQGSWHFPRIQPLRKASAMNRSCG